MHLGCFSEPQMQGIEHVPYMPSVHFFCNSEAGVVWGPSHGFPGLIEKDEVENEAEKLS